MIKDANPNNAFLWIEIHGNKCLANPTDVCYWTEGCYCEKVEVRHRNLGDEFIGVLEDEIEVSDFESQLVDLVG